MSKTAFVLATVSFFSVVSFVGCGKGFPTRTASTNPVATTTPSSANDVESLQSPSANTCVVTRPGGVLDDGSAGSTVLLREAYLSTADQSIYIAGTFPADHYVMHREFTTPTREKLLASASAYKWEIGPAKDAQGQWTKLSVWKEVLNPENNEAYYIDVKTYDYGAPIAFVDADAHLNIECNIPKK